jgi:hypothetical protein
MIFLNYWNDTRHPEYDFDTNELVYRDSGGREMSREMLGVPIDGSGIPVSPAATSQQAALLRRSERVPID